MSATATNPLQGTNIHTLHKHIILCIIYEVGDANVCDPSCLVKGLAPIHKVMIASGMQKAFLLFMLTFEAKKEG